MPSTVLLDACGRRRSPATLPIFHQGRPPRNKEQRYPADPPTVEEIIAVMHAAGEDHDAVRRCVAGRSPSLPHASKWCERRSCKVSLTAGPLSSYLSIVNQPVHEES